MWVEVEKNNWDNKVLTVESCNWVEGREQCDNQAKNESRKLLLQVKR